MEELAEQVSEGDNGLDNAEALIERWDGRPDLVMEDLFEIRDLESKEVTELTLTPYQRRFVHAVWYGDSSTTAVLKGRRTGYSFIAGATALLYAITTPHSFIAITAPSKSQAKDRIDDIGDLIKWAKVDFDLAVDNRDEIELPNGSTLMAFSGNPDTSRGADSADILFIDEMAFLEDQAESMRAFSPFVALGDAQTIELSTPNTANDLFQKDIERGSPDGDNGIIAIEQPAFENPDEIDVNKSLLEQDVNPVMPYLDLEQSEKDRARDPEGFKQEYLCETISDEYRFFSMDKIEDAQERVYETGLRNSEAYETTNKLVMGVDIGFNSDESALTVWEHEGPRRYLRYFEIIDDEKLSSAGITPASRQNPSSIAERIGQVHSIMGVSNVVMDMTGVGQGFHDEVKREIGRGYTGFNFSDKESVEEMMGDFNYALHNDLTYLPDDTTLQDQLGAIVKQQRYDDQKPRFTGKKHAPDGKDDLAIASILGAFPPNFSAEKSDELKQRDEVSVSDEPDTLNEKKLKDEWAGLKISGTDETSGNSREYNSRHSRQTSRSRRI